MNGTPDIIVVHQGRFIGLEVKTAVGRPTDSQKLFGQLCEDNGGVYAVVRSVEEVQAVLDSMHG